VLEYDFEQLYLKFRAFFYKHLVSLIGARKGSLSATELFCLEIILLLDNPTISQFASFLDISLPNANYKINSLVKKNYIEKVNSESDKREYRLVPTDKYRAYYKVNSEYNASFIEKARQTLTPNELEQMNILLKKLNAILH
jgi:DNA-binding MarR family transcriptional regulator